MSRNLGLSEPEQDLSQGQDSLPDSAFAHHIKNFNVKTLTFC